MLPVVAMVAARPETIADDYRRVLKLSGLDDFIRERNPVLVPGAAYAGWRPGFGTTPWQLDCALTANPEGGARVFSLGTGSRSSAPEAGKWGWDYVMSRHGALEIPSDQRAGQPVLLSEALPALEAVVSGRLSAPPVLREAPLLLLPVPQLCREWSLAGAVSWLDRLLTPGRGKSGRIPSAEILANVAGYARSVTGPCAVLMDATVWGVRPARGGPVPLMRNLLLAGTDPVAVDAVAARLAGQDPTLVPWLRLCRDRRWGEIDLDHMILRGQTDLLTLDFQGPPATFAPCARPRSVGRWSGLARIWGRFGASFHVDPPAAWDRLFEEYGTGAV